MCCCDCTSCLYFIFFFSSRRRHTRCSRDWSSDVCSSDLAGYLKRIPPAAVARLRWRVINIHPALLPAFGGSGMYGRRVHQAVLASGVALTGATVHYVDEEYDRGPIIAQWPVPVRPDDTPETLAARVLAVEHRLLPHVVMELARLGVPERPVRLSARGSAFMVTDQPSVRVEEGRG